MAAIGLYYSAPLWAQPLILLLIILSHVNGTVRVVSSPKNIHVAAKDYQTNENYSLPAVFSGTGPIVYQPVEFTDALSKLSEVHDGTIQPAVFKTNSTFFPIGGLFEITDYPYIPTAFGVQQLITFQCAIDLINQREDILKDVFLTFNAIDTQGTPQQALAATMGMIVQNNTIAIIGPPSSSEAIVAASFSSSRDVCMISYSATAVDLSGQSFIPFSRTIPDDLQEMYGLFSFLQAMNWTFILPIFSYNAYGNSGRTLFIQLAPLYNITYECITSVADSSALPNATAAYDTLAETASKIIGCVTQSKANVVLLYMEQYLAVELLSYFHNSTEMDHVVFLFSYMFSIPNDPAGYFQGYIPLSYLQGNVAFLPKRGNLSVLSPCYTENFDLYASPVIIQTFWSYLFRCVDPAFNSITLARFGGKEEISKFPVCSSDAIVERSPKVSCLCTGREDLAQFTPDPTLGYVADGIFSVAAALDRILYNCASVTSFNACEKTQISGKQLFAVMSEFPINGTTGTVGFLGANRLGASYEIVQFADHGVMKDIGTFQRVYNVNSSSLENMNLSTIDYDVLVSNSSIPYYIQDILVLNTSMLNFRSNQNPISQLPLGTESDTVFGIINIALCILIGIISIVAIVFFHRYRSEPSIKRSSPLFNQLILIGMILVCVGSILWTIKQTTATCVTKAWLSVIGFGIIMSSLLVKTYRINKIFHNIKLSRSHLTDLDLIKFGIPILLVEIALLCVYTFANGNPTPVLKVGETSPIFSYIVCTTKDATFQNIMVGLFIGINFVLVVIAAILAYKVRNVIKEYNESAFIAYLMYLYTILAIIIMAVYFAPGFTPSASSQQYISRSVGTLVALMATFCFLIIPKMIHYKQQTLSLSGSDYPSQRRWMEHKTKINISAEEDMWSLSGYTPISRRASQSSIETLQTISN